jgi:hypothetical protein
MEMIERVKKERIIILLKDGNIFRRCNVPGGGEEGVVCREWG